MRYQRQHTKSPFDDPAALAVAMAAAGRAARKVSRHAKDPACDRDDHRQDILVDLVSRAARFDPMRRRLVRLVAAHRKSPLAAPALLEQTLDILRAFPLSTESDPAREQRFAGLAYRQLVPEIILSESFTA